MAKKSQKRRRQEKELLKQGYIECYYCNELVKPRALKCSHCGKWYSTGKKIVAFMMVLIVAVSAVGAYYYLPGHEPNEEPPVIEPTYTHNIGSGGNDFWNRSTIHPSWAVSAVQTRPVLIFTHSVDCAPCITQTAICESIYAKYSAYIEYFDYLSGTDEPEATDTFSAYDPNGEPHYIPLTIVVTKGPNDSIIWHSWEGVVEEPILTGWIEDAITYHNEN